jgi:hypothetical protein
MKSNSRFFIISALIILGAFSRLIPHLPNFTCISALALFGAATYHKKILGFLIPLTALFITDCILGFYPGMLWIYGTFALVTIIGFGLRNNLTVTKVIGASLLSSLSFFIITDFGTWISTTLYAHTPQGLLDCYIAAIPFTRYEVLGTLFYSAVLFGGFYLVQRKTPISIKSDR